MTMPYITQVHDQEWEQDVGTMLEAQAQTLFKQQHFPHPRFRL